MSENQIDQAIILYKASLQKKSSRFPAVPIIERKQHKIDRTRQEEGGNIGEKREGRCDTGIKVIDNAYHLLIDWTDVLKNYGIGSSVHLYKQDYYKGHSGEPKYVLVVPIVKKSQAVPIGDETIITDSYVAQLSHGDYQKINDIMMTLWKYTHGWNNTRINKVSTVNVSNWDGAPGEYNRDQHEKLPLDQITELFELKKRILLIEKQHEKEVA